MNVLDKVVAAVTPNPSDEKMQEARAKARAMAGKSGWLATILDHHLQIEECFAEVKNANSATGRKKAQKQLALMLTGHSIAEESVVYPAMAANGQESGSDELYSEQSTAKVDMAALDDLEPMSQDYLDKLEHIRSAVAHHVYEEESDYFPKLMDAADTATQSKLTRKYKEEFERYVHPVV
jgi:hemerythrin superfamily protein